MLLNGCAAIIRTTFEKHPLFEKDRLVLGHDRVLQVHKAVLDQSWSGIQEYSPEFYKVRRSDWGGSSKTERGLAAMPAAL